MLLMWKNIPIMNIDFFRDGKIKSINDVYDKNLAPLGFIYQDEEHLVDFLNYWWRGNCIPIERDSIRMGLERIGVTSPEQLKFLGHGVSLLNHYWVKEENDNTRWEDINFWDNGMSDEIGKALCNHKGLHHDAFGYSYLSPDSGLNGCLKKRWRQNEKGNFELLKYGSGYIAQEVYNECLAYQLFKAAGIPAASYTLAEDNGNTVCASECLTNPDTELIHASQIYGTIPKKYRESEFEYFIRQENEFEYFIRLLNIYGVGTEEKNRKQLEEMLAIDYCLAGTDRHYSNIGILRSEDGTLELSPIYDSGTCLWSQTNTKQIDILDDTITARPFANSSTFGTWKEQITLIHHYPPLPKEKLIEAVNEYADMLETHSEINEDRINLLCKAVVERAKQLQKQIRQQGNGIPSDCLIPSDYEFKRQSKGKEEKEISIQIQK